MMKFTSFTLDVLVLLSIINISPSSGEPKIILAGDLYIELLASLHGNDNGTCTDVIDVEVVQNIEAVRWTLKRLRQVEFMSGYNIGLRVHASCRSTDYARKMAVDIVTQMTGLEPQNNIVGIFGPDYSSETEAVSELISSLPDKYRLLQLGYTATAVSLKDKSRFKNFFRFIPSDDIQIQTMSAVLQRLNWTYIATVFDDDAYGRGGIELIRKQNEGQGLCFVEEIPIKTTLAEEDIVTIMTSQLRRLVIDRVKPVGGFLVFGSSKLSNGILRAAEIVFRDENVTVPVFMFSEAAGYFVDKFKSVSAGSFILGPQQLFIQDFQDTWTHLISNYSSFKNDANIWIKEAYSQTVGCNLSDTQDNPCSSAPPFDASLIFPPSFYNQYAIQATMAMALVTEKVRELYCGTNVKTVCEEFLKAPRQAFIDVMNSLTVNFDENFSPWRIKEFKDPDLVLKFNGSTESHVQTVQPLYQVFNHRTCPNQPDSFCYVKVGDYYSSIGQPPLTLDVESIRDYDKEGVMSSWPDIRKAQCADGQNCKADCPSRDDLSSEVVISGDLYIVGIVPVHAKGETPVLCGSINSGGFDVAESIKFAIQEAKNNFPGDIPSGNIGSIIIDSCNDPQVIQEKVLSLYRNGVDGDPKVKDKILGFVGAWSSDVSVVLGDILTRLNYTQISYGSTSPELSNTAMYPYFLRIPSSDIYQAETIVKITETIGSQYVQIVYSDGAYGIGGRDVIRDKAKELNMCIVNEIAITESMDKDKLLSSLRQHKDTRVVIIWPSSFDTDWLLPLLNDNFQQTDFVFIASEGLGTRVGLRQYKNLVGTITVALELPPNTKFSDTLKSLIPDGSFSRSWLRDYMESTYNCYYEWSFDKSSNEQCSGSERLDTNTGYKLESWVPFAENAVYALLKGSRLALMDLCGQTETICDVFRLRPERVVAHIKTVQLNLDRLGNDELVFDQNGDGLMGYNIYTMGLQAGNQIVYNKIGESEPTGTFFLALDNWKGIAGKNGNSTCTNSSICNGCGYGSPASTSDKGLPGGLVAVIAILGVIPCILAAVLLFNCNRNGCCIKIENGKPKRTNTYLHAVYSDQSASKMQLEIQENYDTINEQRIGPGAHRIGSDGGARDGEFHSESTIGVGSSAGRSDSSLPSRHDDYLTTVHNAS